VNANELSNEMKRSIWERQSGMCAFTGKKFEDFNDLADADFVFTVPISNAENTDNSEQNETENIVMIWKRHSGLPKDNLKKNLFPYANFQNYKYKAEDKIKDEVDEVTALLNTTTNWRAIENQIREVTNNLNNLKSPIPKSAKDELSKLLLSALNTVEERRSEEYEKNKASWQINYDTVKPKLLEVVEFAKNATIFKEAREKLVGIQNEIRNLKVSRDHKNEFDRVLKDAFDDLNSKQQEFMENFEMECIENYHNIKTMFDDSIHKIFSFETFPEARDLLVEFQNVLKDKVLKKEQRNEFFDAIRKTFDELREKFVEYKLVTTEEATANYAEIKPKVDEAIEFAKNAANDNNAEQANEAREKLLEAQKSVKEIRLKREQKNELFNAIREVFNKIIEIITVERKRFEEETNDNFHTILSKIEVVIVDIENVLDLKNSGDTLAAISTELQLLKLQRKQRDKMFDKLRAAKTLLSKQHLEYNKRKNAERISKLEDSCKNLVEKNERINNLLAKDKEILQQQQEKLAAITDENVHLKKSISGGIDTVNKRIAEREGSISETTKRIEDIKKEIRNITKREKEFASRVTKTNSKQNTKSKKSDTVESAETVANTEEKSIENTEN
jgi:hypothetical protein